MKRVIRFALYIAFFTSANLLAAQKVELTGQVKDSQTKKTLEFCSVIVLNTKDSIIANSVTDNNGYFNISVAAGVYRTVLSFIGYKNDTTQMAYYSQNTFLGIFKMDPSEKMLKEFNVKTNSHDVLIDRDVQVVTEKMKAGASDTKDVLQKLNGVSLDRYSNSIKVDNDAKVIILVDGLEKDQEYIKNLSPDRLKKIEIIRDPGGRYALEGYTAVINIILKKDYQGTEIFASNRTMVDPDAPDKTNFLVQNDASATLNYTYNKVNIYAKYGRNYNNFNLPTTDKKEYDNGMVIESVPLHNDPLNTKVKQLYNNYTIGADYYMNPRHTISFESNISVQPSAKNISDVFFNNTYSSDGNAFDNFSSASNSISGNQSSYNSLFYDGKLNENNTLNSNFTFSNYTDSYTNTYTESTPFQRIENGDDKKNSTKFYLEYFHTFNSKTNLQVGYGNTWEKQNNNYTVSEIESNFKYTDFRHKLYSYFAFQPGKKIGIKFGGAAETSAPISNGIKNSYLIFEPYADIKYNFSKVLDFKLKYRSASNYPNIEQTNPFTNTIDQQSIKTGNPYLHPEVTYKISLQMNIMGGFATVEPYFHFSNNYITETGTLLNDSIFKYSYSNAGKYKHYGVQTNFTIPFSKSIFLQTDVNLFKSSIEYANKIHNLNDWTMTEQLVYVNNKSGLVAGLEYQKNLYRVITAQGYNKWDNDFWITFIQQPFFKKKLNVMLLYFTPITWGVDFMQGSYIKTDNFTESKFSDISFLKNMFMLEVSYRFNQGKSINKKEKNIEQKKEKESKGVI